MGRETVERDYKYFEYWVDVVSKDFDFWYLGWWKLCKNNIRKDLWRVFTILKWTKWNSVYFITTFIFEYFS